MRCCDVDYELKKQYASNYDCIVQENVIDT